MRMPFVKRVSLLCCFLAAIAGASGAQTVIAHRGAFHDTSDSLVLAENSEAAVTEAKKLGIPGVELDLRLASNGVPMVIHDPTSNRSTSDDGLRGAMNAVDTYMGEQTSPNPISISSATSSFWTAQTFKAYTNGGYLLTGGNYEHPDTIDQMIDYIYRNRASFFDGNAFKIIFDIQDPTIFSYAGKVLQGYPSAFANNFYLKFFVSKALYASGNGSPYIYDGPTVCYRYAIENHLQGLNIIPQINDGELTSDENEDDDLGIKAFSTTLTPETYLQCWADASSQHSDAPKMPIVSASVPFDNDHAVQAASAALEWARNNSRQTMTIFPNPDVSTKYPSCIYLSFRPTPPYAAKFDTTAQGAKGLFALDQNPDYTIADVMGHPGGGFSYTWYSNAYNNAMCR